MKNLKIYQNIKKRGLAMATAAVLMMTPMAVKAEGLGDLLSSYGIEAEEYTKNTLDLQSWEKGFVDAYKKYTPLVPSLKEMSGQNLAALYYFSNYNFTPEELVPELAKKGYISENNCVDLGVIRRDDPNTAEDETMTEIVDQEGFYNFINATQCFATINDMAERKMHSDWIKLQNNG